MITKNDIESITEDMKHTKHIEPVLYLSPNQHKLLRDYLNNITVYHTTATTKNRLTISKKKPKGTTII